MRYTIESLSQRKAVELGLDLSEIMILRWFIDYSNTGKMTKVIINDKLYYWINYKGLLEDLPILAITKDRLYRKLRHLVDVGVLEHTVVKQAGTYSYYREGNLLKDLIDDSCYAVGKNTVGYGKNTVGGTVKTTEQITNILESKNTIKENVEQSSTPHLCKDVINYLNDKIGSNFRYTSKDTVKLIGAREKEGYIFSDFKKVIDIKVKEWQYDKKMAPYLRPSTLFSPKFESYLNQYREDPVRKSDVNEELNEFMQEVLTHVENGDGLYIWSSGTGNGKTTWACKIVSHYFRKIAFNSGLEFEGLYIYLPTFLEDLRSSYSDPDPEFLEELEMVKRCKILIIDDIGAEKPSEWVSERLLSFINTRVSNGLSTIYTSNLSLDELESKIGRRIRSRIEGSTKEIQLIGKDRRSN